MNAMEKTLERRVSPRVAVQGLGRYRKMPIDVRGHRLQNAKIRDLSEHGFRFQVDELIGAETELLLELHVPGSPDIRSLGTVAWVRAMPASDSFEVGGAFVEPTDEARGALGRIVQGH